YWEISQDGTVYAFGNAHTYPPATPGAKPVRPVVAMAATADGKGYSYVPQVRQGPGPNFCDRCSLLMSVVGTAGEWR
ncbi:MAG: hypothetical protein ACRD0J_17905, partial [Acidimicrobiales bacterium]